ncbi:MAG: reverse transcriptase-like protein, partial [Microgenomates group bacterium]
DSHPQEATLPVICYLDSKLVVEQLSKNWKIKEPRMKLLAENCWKTLISIPNSVSFRHIPREKNTDSDALVNKALDAQVE